MPGTFFSSQHASASQLLQVPTCGLELLWGTNVLNVGAWMLWEVDALGHERYYGQSNLAPIQVMNKRKPPHLGDSGGTVNKVLAAAAAATAAAATTTTAATATAAAAATATAATAATTIKTKRTALRGVLL